MRTQLYMALTCLSLATLQNRAFSQAAEPAAEEKNLRLSGPRIGMVVYTGNIAQRIEDPLSSGGLNAKPVMSQFGYQFETAYISGDNLQALFEFVPTFTGLDQGKFLPSFGIFHGLRLQKTGLEFALGPVIYVAKRQKGFFDTEKKWHALQQWRSDNPGEPDPDNVVTTLDTRGEYGITTSFVLSIGKNFRSGNMNLPVNFYAIPHAEGARYGISVGFNKLRY